MYVSLWVIIDYAHIFCRLELRRANLWLLLPMYVNGLLRPSVISLKFYYEIIRFICSVEILHFKANKEIKIITLT